MAISHTAPGELIDVRSGDGKSARPESKTLIRTSHLEVLRYVLTAGKVVAKHAAAGVMILQCVEGAVEFEALGRAQTLTSGSMLWLPDGEPHALKALEDSTLLMTLLLRRE